jgi:hypothetical protein
MDAAVVLQPLLDTDRNLAMEAVSACVDGGTDNTGKPRIEEELPTYDDEDPGSARVSSRRMPDSEEIASCHGMT